MVKFIPYSSNEHKEVLRIAHRHMLFTRKCYLWAKSQVNDPMSSLPNNGLALNICKRYKLMYKRSADRVKVLLYDVREIEPGGAG